MGNGGDFILLLDKPGGLTSFDAISRARSLLGIRKIGHSGTLDKFASGLLVVGAGQATKLTRYFLESEKGYSGVIRLGTATESDDIEGRVIETGPVDHISEADIRSAAERFRGSIEQVPPVYSALKRNGRRVSDLARSGKDVVLEPRPVVIRRFDVIDIDLGSGRISFEMECSKGTYVRSVARDLGRALGTVAHLEVLRRFRSGRFLVEDAVTLADLERGELHPGRKFRLSPREALSGCSVVTVNGKAAGRVKNGAEFSREDIIELENGPEKNFIILDERKNLIAIADMDIERWKICYLNVFNETVPS